MDSDIPYLLLTPGPLTTSRTVRQAMMCDYSTWDIDYNTVVNQIRRSIVRIATDQPDYTCTLMPGSGTFAVEATLGSVIPRDGKVLVISNGAYGERIAQIANRLAINHIEVEHTETELPDVNRIGHVLSDDHEISHIAMVHCETTTGMLNPVEQIGKLAVRFNKSFILDAMSSFGGIPMTMESNAADFLISSANKCIQGVPGFGFVVARKSAMQQIEGRARSLSLDLYDQWQEMENNGGKWRYTSPTHVVCAFAQALEELEEEGGVTARHRRYCDNHQRMVEGMQRIGLRTLLPADLQSPIITSFLYPDEDWFEFRTFYDKMKSRRFVLYPGKVSNAECFRIGTIGHVFPDDMTAVVANTGEVLKEMAEIGDVRIDVEQENAGWKLAPQKNVLG
ncbi:MAG: 2-aminoethylphosphonate--pyruvate transaminase [Pirellulaceae bacterium]